MSGRIHLFSWLSGRMVKSLKYVIAILILLIFLYAVKQYTSDSTRANSSDGSLSLHQARDLIPTSTTSTNKHTEMFDTAWLNKPPELLKRKEAAVTRKASKINKDNTDSTTPKPCQNLHAFYYPWYGNPKFDNKYIHWNHKYIPHWDPNIAKRYPKGVHEPPDDVGSDFYPELGSYSSRDPDVIANHMEQLVSANVGVIIISYYPPTTADDNGEDWQDIFALCLTTADKYGIKVGFHIEPYQNRNERTVKEDLKHMITTYSKYPAFLKFTRNGKTLPLIYIYDSYHTKPEEWKRILSPSGSNTIRDTPFDAHVIGLYVEAGSERQLFKGGFDGFYTYFAANGFTYGSTRRNWNRLKQVADQNNMMFIPSIGPGYLDTRVRPWNEQNTRHRSKGQYYKESWNEALKLEPDIISITSFNEWHEGTQIEKAVPHMHKSFVYKDYKPYSADYYLLLTNSMSKKFPKCK